MVRSGDDDSPLLNTVGGWGRMERRRVSSSGISSDSSQHPGSAPRTYLPLAWVERRGEERRGVSGTGNDQVLW